MSRVAFFEESPIGESLSDWPQVAQSPVTSAVAEPAAGGAPRILTIVNSFDPGGVERVALRLNAAWRKIGMQTRIVAGQGTGYSDEGADKADYRIISDEVGATTSWPIGRLLRHLPGIIRDEQPDLIFCPGNTYTLVAVALKLSLGKACPPIVAKISNDLHRRDMNPVTRFFYHRWLWVQGRLIDRFVAMAPSMVAEIEQRMGVTRDRITVINDPVLSTQELFDYARIAHVPALRGRRFIAIGRLVPQKNFPLLIDAFARIARPEDRLTILDEGPERDAVARRAAMRGVSNQLVMPGHINDVRPWFASADIFCMSSNFEGIPAVIVEAIAARLSIVATDCSAGMGELVGYGRFGTLVPVGDAELLARAMDSAPLGQALPAEALEHVRAFTLEAGAQAYARLGTALLNGKPVRRLATA